MIPTVSPAGWSCGEDVLFRVDYKADVGFIDAHAEGVGGHHDRGPVVGKTVPVLPPLRVVQTRVVAGGGETELLQLLFFSQ